MKLRPHELMALRFLESGPDTIGVIDTEEKLAAAIVFSRLKDQGLIISSIDPKDGPTYYLAPAGRAALKEDLHD